MFVASCISSDGDEKKERALFAILKLTVLTPKKVKTSDTNAMISVVLASASPTTQKSNFFDG